MIVCSGKKCGVETPSCMLLGSPIGSVIMSGLVGLIEKLIG